MKEHIKMMAAIASKELDAFLEALDAYKSPSASDLVLRRSEAGVSFEECIECPRFRLLAFHVMGAPSFRAFRVSLHTKVSDEKHEVVYESDIRGIDIIDAHCIARDLSMGLIHGILEKLGEAIPLRALQCLPAYQEVSQELNNCPENVMEYLSEKKGLRYLAAKHFLVQDENTKKGEMI